MPATQCHHFQGRRGMLLLYEPFWIPVSWEGHRWIEDHRQWAGRWVSCARWAGTIHRFVPHKASPEVTRGDPTKSRHQPMGYLPGRQSRSGSG